MDWESYWNKKIQAEGNLSSQVQRTQDNKELRLDQIQSYLDHVRQCIKDAGKEQLIDLCCGNGMLTSSFAQDYNEIKGVDFSKSLIEIAKQNFENEKVHFEYTNVLKMNSSSFKSADVVLLLFAFQYFVKKEGTALIDKVQSTLEPGAMFFIGDIPDKSRQYVFAGKGLNKWKYKIKYGLGLDQTGNFWSANDLDKICKDLNLVGRKIEQPSHLPYAHYRFDYLITKK